MKGKMCGVHKVAAGLLFIGGLNWGLVAINPAWNLVDMAFGAGSTAARVIYGLVGIAAIAMLACAKCCMKGGCCGSCKGGACEGGSCAGSKCSGKMEGKGCKGAQGGSCNGGQMK